MKYIIILLIAIFCLENSFCQINKTRSTFFCGYDEKLNEKDICTNFSQKDFITNKDAEDAVDKLLNQLGLPKNFVLVSCPKINNAIAITSNLGIRYIVYDPLFMKKINQTTNDWSSIGILAHELCHHLSGHTLTVSKNYVEQQKKELEADEFSGFILAKLGAPLVDCQAALKSVSKEKDDTYSSHPRLSRRLLSIKKGYLKAKSNSTISNVSYSISLEQLFGESLKLVKSHEYSEAIEKLTKVIKINSNYFYAWSLRSLCRFFIEDYYGAISDATESINLQDTPKSIDYNTRGDAKFSLKDYKGAISDYNIAISNGLTNAYISRAAAKLSIEDFRGAIEDCDYVISTQVNSESNSFEIEWGRLYGTRAIAKLQLGYNQSGCEDAKISCQYGYKFGCRISEDFCKQFQ